MALIKCTECESEMSDRAKVCPNCGFENSIAFCPECNTKISGKASLCPHCGYALKQNMINNTTTNNSSGNNFGIALAGLICSVLPFCGILGIIFSVIGMNSNKGQKNTAKTMSIVGLCLGGASIIITIFWIFLTVIIAISSRSVY